jgi:hypothetical protein
MATCYLALICRTQRKQISSYPILLTDEQTAAVAELEDSIDQCLDLQTAVQRLAFSLLTTYRVETTDDEMTCPLRRFLIVKFLNEDGTFIPVQHMPPQLSRLQYFLRVVAIIHADARRGDYAEGPCG